MSTLCTRLLRAASLSATIGLQGISTFGLIRFAPLAVECVRLINSNVVHVLQPLTHQGTPLLHFCFVSRHAKHATCCFCSFWIRELLTASETFVTGSIRSRVSIIVYFKTRSMVWSAMEVAVRCDHNSESREASAFKFVRRTHLVDPTLHMCSIIFASEVVPMCQ